MRLIRLLRSFSRRPHPQKAPKYDIPLTAEAIKALFSDCSDFQTRTLSIGGSSARQADICYIDGLADGAFLSDSVIRPLTDKERFPDCRNVDDCIDAILCGAVFSNSVSEKSSADGVVEAIVKGFVALIFSREQRAVVFEVRTGVARSISVPTLEKAVKGSKDSFIERLRINTMLVRQRLRTPDLKMVRAKIGRRSDTDAAIVYISGIANPEIVAQMQERLAKIDIDGVLATGNLEEYLSDNPYSPFPQTTFTERPDRFAMNLLDGRVGLLVDGLPLGLIVPCTLSEIMRVPEDRSQHFMVATFLRILRYIAAFISVLLPAAYISIAMYHQEMIPLKLLMAIIESKHGVPFSIGTEIVGMLIAFELLQEAGLRLPNPVGETVSIIGALIVGQSAVEAKIISPLAVIIVATAGIAGYTMPSQDLSSVLRLCRFFMVVCALFAGMFGMIVGLALITYHLCRIDSFGISFLSPLADGGPLGFFRAFVRKPLINDKYRDPNLNTTDKRNQI